MIRLNVEDLEGRALMSATLTATVAPTATSAAVVRVVEVDKPAPTEQAAIYMKVEGVKGFMAPQGPVGDETVQRSGYNIVQTYPATEYFTAPIGSNKGSFMSDGQGVDEGAWGVNK